MANFIYQPSKYFDRREPSLRDALRPYAEAAGNVCNCGGFFIKRAIPNGPDDIDYIKVCEYCGNEKGGE